jgi:hypothetical protein
MVILQEFDLEFEPAKSNKYLVFAELICDLPSTETENVAEDSLPDESLFLIHSDDVWYEDIIIYSTTQVFQQRMNTFSNHSHNQIKDQHTDVFTW